MRKSPVSFVGIFYILQCLCSICCSGIRSNELVNRLQSQLVESNSEITSWLQDQLPHGYLEVFKIKNIYSHPIPQIADESGRLKTPEFFNDRKKLFLLAEMLLDMNFKFLASQVMNYLREKTFYSSTYSCMIYSLNLTTLTVFDHILTMWFPTYTDQLNAIQNIVVIRSGEDCAILFLDMIWSAARNALPAPKFKERIANILLSAMRAHYVSLFEMIIERKPNIIDFIVDKSPHANTILHHFASNPSPENINHLVSGKAYRRHKGDSPPDSPSPPDIKSALSLDSIFLEHDKRSYPGANKEIIEAILKTGIDINSLNKHGASALQLAISNGNSHIVRNLLEFDANPNLIDPETGATLLCLAINTKNIDIVESMIKNDADFNYIDPVYNRGVLHHAIKTQNIDIIRILLKNGIDVNGPVDNIDGFSPLFLAVRLRSPEIVSLLLSHGADHKRIINGKNLTQQFLRYKSSKVGAVLDNFIAASQNKSK